MKKLLLAVIPAMLATTACAGTPAPAGHWIQGANKMAIFVPAKSETDCKYVPGYVGKGPRAVYGSTYTCK